MAGVRSHECGSDGVVRGFNGGASSRQRLCNLCESRLSSGWRATALLLGALMALALPCAAFRAPAPRALPGEQGRARLKAGAAAAVMRRHGGGKVCARREALAVVSAATLAPVSAAAASAPIPQSGQMPAGGIFQRAVNYGKADFKFLSSRATGCVLMG
jgi:hypothetical protein